MTRCGWPSPILDLRTTAQAPLDLHGQVLVLPRISLQTIKETKLDEVRITAAMPVIERKIDRTVVNVDALLSTSGSTAMDALERSPGVTVDQNGLIKLKGKVGVLVLIDDKPTYMSGQDLENYLRSLPSSALKSIEIMPNPPAKYDAAGGGGVLNIKTKRNNIKGYNGNINLGYQQGRYAKSNNSLNLNYRNKRFNLFSSLSSGFRNTFQDLYINRVYFDSTGYTSSAFHQRSYIQRNMGSHNAKVGIDYYLTDNTTIGIVANGQFSPSQNNTDNLARILTGTFNLLNNVTADNREETKFLNTTFNANLRHQFDSTGRVITVDADYVAFFHDEEHLFLNEVRNPDNVVAYSDQLDGLMNSDIRILAAKADYSHPFKQGGTLEAGAKSSYTTTDNSAFYLRTIGGNSEVDYTITNQFIYKELIAAAYVNYNQQFKRFGLQSGLRAEGTRSTGNQLGNPLHPATQFKRDYNSLFPTLFLSYNLDSAGKHGLNFNLGRRITRPIFQDLNPFLSPLDRYTFYSGNPFLRPSFTYNAALAYTYNNLVTVTLNYSKGLNEIMETLEIVDGIYYSRPGNIGTSEFLTVSMEGNFPIAKWLTTTMYAEAGRNRFTGPLYNQQLEAGANFLFLNANNSFKFGKKWSAEISGEYISAFSNAQVVTGDFGFFNVGLKRNLLKDKASLRVNLSDVLYTRRFRGVINNLDNTFANYHSTVDSRVLGFAFSYRFGSNLGEQKRHTGSGSETEQQRIAR
jgi:hypothetical protein